MMLSNRTFPGRSRVEPGHVGDAALRVAPEAHSRRRRRRHCNPGGSPCRLRTLPGCTGLAPWSVSCCGNLAGAQRWADPARSRWIDRERAVAMGFLRRALKLAASFVALVALWGVRA